MSSITFNGSLSHLVRWKVFCKKDDELIEITFADCIFDVLNVNDDIAKIQLHYTPDRLTFSKEISTTSLRSPLEESYALTLKHGSRCPLRELRQKKSTKIPDEIISRGIAVGVATLVQSSDKYILLTKRSAHMRTFPGCWVPPGGHVEVGESLKFAANREVTEEIGLDLDFTGNSMKMIGVWESIYPPVLDWGSPNRHHIVIYYLFKSLEKRDNLHQKLKIDPNEVSVCAWLTAPQVSSLLSIDPIQNKKFASAECLVSLAPTHDEAQQTCHQEIRELFTFDGFIEGRITVGTKFALEEWCKQIEQENLDNPVPTAPVSPRL